MSCPPRTAPTQVHADHTAVEIVLIGAQLLGIPTTNQVHALAVVLRYGFHPLNTFIHMYKSSIFSTLQSFSISGGHPDHGGHKYVK